MKHFEEKFQDVLKGATGIGDFKLSEAVEFKNYLSRYLITCSIEADDTENLYICSNFNLDRFHCSEILKSFFKNFDSVETALDQIAADIVGELPEFISRGLKGYMCYGNREVIFYLDDTEEVYMMFLDTYGTNKTLVWE